MLLCPMLAILALSTTLNALAITRETSSCNGFFLGSSPSPGENANCTIWSGGVLRSYILYLPPDYSPLSEHPLILSYHGGLRTAAQQLELDELTAPYFQTSYIVVYPQGINDTWQGVPQVPTNDVQFTTDILDHLQANYAIDALRIFATGKSDGAGFDNVLACDWDLSRRIAAFAPVSGAFYVPDSGPSGKCHPKTVAIPCTPGRGRVPIMEFHGGNDTTIAYAGGARKGECLPSIPHWARRWAARDGLSTRNVTMGLEGGEAGVDTTRVYVFGRGDSHGLVKQVFDPVIGHDWPSTAPNADNQEPGHVLASFNATPMILDFFETHPMGSLVDL